jgi:hypothetical protein
MNMQLILEDNSKFKMLTWKEMNDLRNMESDVYNNNMDAYMESFHKPFAQREYARITDEYNYFVAIHIRLQRNYPDSDAEKEIGFLLQSLSEQLYELEKEVARELKQDPLPF